MTPAAFAARDAAVAIETFGGETMGTSWSLQAVAPPPGVADGVVAALDRVIGQMSQWEGESALSRFNRAPPGEWHGIADEFAHVVGAALVIGRASDGAFDPCLGRTTETWGFGAAGPVQAVPAMGAPGAGAAPMVELDEAGKRIRRTETAALDLSGIAKGFGVDLASEWLLANGVRHFLMEIGGELRGEGIRPDGQPWWVDVEVPPHCSLAPWRAALHDLSAATSGNYRRGFSVDGQYYSHSFDPATGQPITHRVQSVTVFHRSCMMADGWATALTVLGPDAAIALADREGLAACVISDNFEYISDAWRLMLS